MVGTALRWPEIALGCVCAPREGQRPRIYPIYEFRPPGYYIRLAARAPGAERRAWSRAVGAPDRVRSALRSSGGALGARPRPRGPCRAAKAPEFGRQSGAKLCACPHAKLTRAPRACDAPRSPRKCRSAAALAGEDPAPGELLVQRLRQGGVGGPGASLSRRRAGELVWRWWWSSRPVDG